MLEYDLLQPSLMRHSMVRDSYNSGGRGIASVDIPLVGYEGATKTKFSERPIFVDGGGRIVNEEAVSQHDAKLLGARNRRQRQLAERKGSSGASLTAAPTPVPTPPASFEKVQNFGSGGVAGFLAQQAGAPAT